jgi:hypothetical protein
MKLLRIVAFPVLIFLADNTSNGQPIRIDFGAGLRGSFHSYLLKYPTAEYTSVGSPDLLRGDITFPEVFYNLRPFLGASYLFTLHRIPQIDLPRLGLNGWHASAGLASNYPLGKARIALQVAIGYQWNNFSLTQQNAADVSFAHDAPIYSLGVSLYLPFFDKVDVALAYRLSATSTENVDGFIGTIPFNLTGPSVLNDLTVGLSFSLQDTEQSTR